MLDKMLAEFTDLAELREYAQAQFKTIVEQNRKIQDLETELAKIRGSTQSLTLTGAVSLDDQETVARGQMLRLKEISASRELTLEEARKLEIYSKIINQIESRAKKDVITTKAIDTRDLVSALNDATE